MKLEHERRDNYSPLERYYKVFTIFIDEVYILSQIIYAFSYGSACTKYNHS